MVMTRLVKGLSRSVCPILNTENKKYSNATFGTEFFKNQIHTTRRKLIPKEQHKQKGTTLLTRPEWKKIHRKCHMH